MKKLLFLLAAFVLTFSLAACSTEDLDNQIADLEQEVSDLTDEVTTLEDAKTSLEDEKADLEAYLPVAGDYTPGIYYGMDEAHGYYATVIINSAGGIEEVILNALNPMDPDGVENSGDEYVTTKQALQGDYGMLGITGKGWFEHANELAAALVANQGWSADWDIISGDRHDKFDVEDNDVIMDDIAGVTIGIEGFKIAFEEAIGQAE